MSQSYRRSTLVIDGDIHVKFHRQIDDRGIIEKMQN